MTLVLVSLRIDFHFKKVKKWLMQAKVSEVEQMVKSLYLFGVVFPSVQTVKVVSGIIGGLSM